MIQGPQTKITVSSDIESVIRLTLQIKCLSSYKIVLIAGTSLVSIKLKIMSLPLETALTMVLTKLDFTTLNTLEHVL